MIALYVLVFVIPAGLYAILRSPSVQNYITQKAAGYFSKELGTKVSIGGVNVSFFLDLILEDVIVQDHHHNTLLYAGYIKADVDNIDFDKQNIQVGKVSLDHAFFALMKYENEDELNIQFLADYFKPKEADTTKKAPWNISVNALSLISARFIYNDHNAHRPLTGMDYGNIDVSDINLVADHIKIRGDTISACILHLTARDKCGLTLQSFTSEFEINSGAMLFKRTHLTTPASDLTFDLGFYFKSWKDFNDFERRVTLDANLRSVSLNGSDIGYFAPELKEFNEVFAISGIVHGQVDSLSANNLDIKYGNYTRFIGNVLVTGLPVIDTSQITARIKAFTTHYEDLAKLKVPDGKGGVMHMDIPPEVIALGHVKVSGQFKGYYNDFMADAKLVCDLGSASASVHLRDENGKTLNAYTGTVYSDGFNIGALIQSNGLIGNIALDAEINGSGFTKETASLRLKGAVNAFEFKNYTYHNLTVDGELSKRVFNGKLVVADENLKMDFVGYVDFRDSIPVYDFKTNVFLARLNKINLIKSDSITDVSCKLTSHFQGTNADNLTGTITLENASYKDGGQDYQLKYLKVTALLGLYNYRSFFVKSDYVDAEFHGTFYFEDLFLSVKKYIASYLPGINFKKDSINKPTRKQDFNFDITFYNADPVLKYFVKDLAVSPNTRLKGKFDTEEEKLNFEFTSERCTYQKIEFQQVFSNAVTEQKAIRVTTGCKRIVLIDTAHIDNIELLTLITHDSLNYQLTWDNRVDSVKYAADIKGYMVFDSSRTYLGMLPSWFALHDTTWNIYSGGNIIIDSTGAVIPGVYLTSNQQRLEVKGKVSRSRTDRLRVKFVDMNLSDFDYVTEKLDFDLDGILSGYFDVYGALGKPFYASDLKVAHLGFNNTIIGDASVLAKWDDLNDGIKIESDVLYVTQKRTAKPVRIEGFYFPEDEKNNLALNIYILNFDLSSLSRYLDGVAEIKEGYAIGSFSLNGPLNDPELKGSVQLTRTHFRVDYLNTDFSTAHKEVRFDKHGIYFENMEVRTQPESNKALCNGKITHNKFKDWKFDIELFPDKLLCLNTDASQNELFYGKAYVSGYAHIFGDANNVKVDLDVKTERNTQLFIPMDYTSEVSENDFIIFTGQDGTYVPKVVKNELAGITLSGKFQVTDEAEVQILFDPAVGDRIRGRGNGNLTMEITPDGNFYMSGDYTVKSGDYLFTFENVLNKRFSIEEGGTIRWTGDPYEAELNLRAIYRLKTSMNSLGYETNKGSVPVNCIINMSGMLTNPLFSFEIDLPGMSDVEKNNYLAIINQNLNYNFLTLLIVNSFYNPGVTAGGSGNSTVANASVIGNIPSEVLSNQMSNWLSQISKKVDIGVNYRPGDQITQQQVEVALSTQLFDERVKIEGNVGMGGGLVNSSTKNSSNIVGDVNVEVRLTDNTRLHVFNKSNQQDYLLNDVPYTQGVGVFYRKEFNTFKELFKRQKPKKERKKKKSS